VLLGGLTAIVRLRADSIDLDDLALNGLSGIFVTRSEPVVDDES